MKEEQIEVIKGNQWVLQLSGTTLRADRLYELAQLSVILAKQAPILYTIENQRMKSDDRIAIIGANGTGKSSLLKMIWALNNLETTEKQAVDNTVFQQDVLSVSLEFHSDEDEKLLKLIELEEKLEADLARKTQHQKPVLQAQWQLEINQLKQMLKLV